MDPMTPSAQTVGSEAILVAHDPAAASPEAPSMWMNIAPIAAMIAIFYFLLIRPQQAERKAHENLLASLKKGDPVVTASGLHGKVHEVKGDTVVLEVADKVRLTVDRVAVKRKVGGDAGAEAGA
jgi:preprotein translocase subunit YajC